MNGIDFHSLLAGLVAVGLFGIIGLWLRLRRRPRTPSPAGRDLRIALESLPAWPPSADAARLDFYGTPVRLAAVVLAPAGRTGELPPANVLPGVIEHVVPGLAQVIADHRPRLYRWPVQLSSQGFQQAFFNNARLPGTRGKGTPWCSIAGRFQIGERTFLLGMICVADRPNGLGQVVVQHEGQWPDVLRIRTADE